MTIDEIFAEEERKAAEAIAASDARNARIRELRAMLRTRMQEYMNAHGHEPGMIFLSPEAAELLVGIKTPNGKSYMMMTRVSVSLGADPVVLV